MRRLYRCCVVICSLATGISPGLLRAAASDADFSEKKNRLSWVWTTPHAQPAPAVRNAAWPADRVDSFILRRLEEAGLKPAPPAERHVWLRRVYFALVGLPPSPEALTEFLGDDSSSAREKVVDRLLASPHFGERWGRHWLDLMRYAESRGHESDYIIPNAYEYRDYVVRALNADVPYDQFVREHLAGDLLPNPRRNLTEGFNESILGTGWAFLGEEIHAPVDTRQDETDRIDNRIDVMSKAFLGLTVACARCHDHKFDAISQRDYYALAGFFLSSSERLARFETMENNRAIAQELDWLKEKWEPELAAKLVEAQQPVLARLDEYLIAAAEAGSSMKGMTNRAAKQLLRVADFDVSAQARVTKLAKERSLNPATLSYWTAALLNAPNDSNNPLQLFSRLAFAMPVNGHVQPAAGLPEGARVVVDFRNVSPGEWHADGVAFGLHPIRPGELTIAKSSLDQCFFRVTSRSAAQSNPGWRALDLRAGVEREPALYGAWQRDGIMVRTPKFELTSGKLFYLVRGSGRLFAAVDSQRLVTGPVHTGLVREWPFKDEWHWFAHDLSDYKGHRVEIEFSPGQEFDTAIATVIESATPPAAPPSLSQSIAGLVLKGGLLSIKEAAVAYQKIFAAASQLPTSIATNETGAELADWLAQRPELFCGEENKWTEPLTRVAAEYFKARQPLVSRVQWKSRTAPAMLEGNGVDEYLLVRGKHQTPKGLVPRRFLEAISGPEPIRCVSSSGRRELAEAMVDRSNPLLARVFVNRVWHHLFGRGLAPTVDNFGWLGQRPSHPELLDDLAVRFIEEDRWSLKRLVRRLVLSNAYAMSSSPSDAEAERADPENILLHRMNIKRLEGEAIRDAMLTVSGRLDRRMFGVSVPLHPSQFVEARGLRNERGPLDGAGRRSIYIAARRNFLPMMFTAFDTPTPFTTVGQRNVSNVPGQMLFLMNDPFVHEQAEVWAHHLELEQPNASAEERLRLLFLEAFSREPSAQELDHCLETLRAMSDLGEQPKANLWLELCHALFSAKEFIYVL